VNRRWSISAALEWPVHGHDSGNKEGEAESVEFAAPHQVGSMAFLKIG
jgi:hypothetical protein